jgi:hypothetical protein
MLMSMQMKDTLRYELPADGITLLGYIVRRMHKTKWLLPVKDFLATEQTSQALAHIAMYAMTASTSFGRAFYQPRFNQQGNEVSEPDPDTGAFVSARLNSVDPHYLISYVVKMADGGVFEGSEEITGTKIGLQGLGMPAPSRFSYAINDYSAGLTGLLTSELALSLVGRTRIRAYGSLNIADNAENKGEISIDRHGRIKLEINGTNTVPGDAAPSMMDHA